MAPDRNRATPSSSSDGDGVRVSEHGRGRGRTLLFKCAAVLLLAGGSGYLLMTAAGREHERQAQGSPSETPADTAPAVSASTSGGAASAAMVRPRTATPTRGEDISLDLADYIDPSQPIPDAGEVIRKLNEAGIHSGIGAFNPPGTSPPLVGLAVPSDIELPEGYVRHHQTTDDGQDIEPILMFSPDYDFFDAAGRPIAIPENRVVPPDMAPPGVPGRRIVIPPPKDPARP